MIGGQGSHAQGTPEVAFPLVLQCLAIDMSEPLPQTCQLKKVTLHCDNAVENACAVLRHRSWTSLCAQGDASDPGCPFSGKTPFPQIISIVFASCTACQSQVTGSSDPYGSASQKQYNILNPFNAGASPLLAYTRFPPMHAVLCRRPSQ